MGTPNLSTPAQEAIVDIPVSAHSKGYVSPWQRFIRHKLALTGATVLLIESVASALAPWIAPYKPNALDFNAMQAAPSFAHLMGTNGVGMDEFTRILYGGRISLLIGIFSMLVAIFIGGLLGSVAGYYGGWIDNIIMRMTDIALSIPLLFLLLILSVILGHSPWIIIGIIGVTNWMYPTRIVRSQFISLKHREFVEASRAMGSSDFRIIFKEILPNAVAPLIVNATLMVGQAIILESVMSFLGLGIQVPYVTWGNMLAGAQSYIYSAPWLAFFPGIMIFITVLAFNLVGDGLRDALDPTAKKG